MPSPLAAALGGIKVPSQGNFLTDAANAIGNVGVASAERRAREQELARQEALLKVQQDQNRIRENFNTEQIRIQDEGIRLDDERLEREQTRLDARQGIIQTARAAAANPGQEGGQAAIAAAMAEGFSRSDIFDPTDADGGLSPLQELSTTIAGARGLIESQLSIIEQSDNVETSDEQVALPPEALAELQDLRTRIAGGETLERADAIRHNELAAQTRGNTITANDLLEFGRNWVSRLRQEHPEVPFGMFAGMVDEVLRERAPLMFTEDVSDAFGRAVGVDQTDIGDVDVPDAVEGSTAEAAGSSSPSTSAAAGSGRGAGGTNMQQIEGISAIPKRPRSTPMVTLNSDGSLTTAAQRQLESLVQRALDQSGLG